MRPVRTVNGLADVRVTFDGWDAKGRVGADLLSVRVEDDLGAVAACTLELANWNQHALEFVWSREERLAPGTGVEVWLGYVGSLERVFDGEIVALEPSFEAGRPSRLVVRAFDRLHRLQRGTRSRSFLKATDSAVVQRVANDAGLRAVVLPTTKVHDHVLQHNQSDWAFLRDRADRLRWALFVRDRTLHFRPLAHGGSAVFEALVGDASVLAFRPRLSARSAAASVSVRGWDVRRKEPIEAEVRRRGAAGNPYGPGDVAVVDLPVRSLAEADAQATGMVGQRELDHVVAELVLAGSTAVRVGDALHVQGVGERFGGRFFVTGVAHALDAASGFRTRLQLRRGETT